MLARQIWPERCTCGRRECFRKSEHPNAFVHVRALPSSWISCSWSMRRDPQKTLACACADARRRPAIFGVLSCANCSTSRCSHCGSWRTCNECASACADRSTSACFSSTPGPEPHRRRCCNCYNDYLLHAPSSGAEWFARLSRRELLAARPTSCPGKEKTSAPVQILEHRERRPVG